MRTTKRFPQNNNSAAFTQPSSRRSLTLAAKCVRQDLDKKEWKDIIFCGDLIWHVHTLEHGCKFYSNLCICRHRDVRKCVRCSTVVDMVCICVQQRTLYRLLVEEELAPCEEPLPPRKNSSQTTRYIGYSFPSTCSSICAPRERNQVVTLSEEHETRERVRR